MTIISPKAGIENPLYFALRTESGRVARYGRISLASTRLDVL